MEAIVPCEDLKCVLVLIGEDKVLTEHGKFRRFPHCTQVEERPRCHFLVDRQGDTVEISVLVEVMGSGDISRLVMVQAIVQRKTELIAHSQV